MDYTAAGVDLEYTLITVPNFIRLFEVTMK